MLMSYFDTTFIVRSFIRSLVIFYSSTASQLRMKSFRAGSQQKLLIFVPNTVKIFRILWYCLFL